MDREPMAINERTSVPLFAVLAAAGVCVPLIVGGVIWLATIDSKASAAQEEMKGLKGLMIDVRERVIRLETTIKDSERRR